MSKFNMIISIVCAVIWTYNGITGGFDLFGICVTILWWLSAVLFTVGYFKKRKHQDKENP